MTKNKAGIILFRQESEDARQVTETKRYKEELAKLGFETEIYYTEFFSVFFKKNKIEIFYNNKKFDTKKIAFVIPKYSLTNGNLYSRFSLIDYLKKAGLKTYNEALPAMISKNKRDSLILLAENGLEVVPTGINYSQFFLDEQLRRNNGNKIICKASHGTCGYNVAICESPISFISFMEFVGPKTDPANILIQPYIDADMRDYRVIVVGDKAIVAMQRNANGIEFRANLSKGGNGKKINPTKKMVDMATKATKVLGLDYGGVDFIKDKKGKLMILEVNANPMLGIEKVTGVNVVESIVKHCAKKAGK